MGLFAVTLGEIGLLETAVWVNGSRDSRLGCLRITRGAQLGTTQAELWAPSLRYDDDVADLQEAFVLVYVKGPDGQWPSVPDFAGFIDGEQGGADMGHDGRVFRAWSMSHYLRGAYVGETTHQAATQYLLTDPVTGAATGWTVARVIEELFDNLPTYYKAKLGLGLTSALQRSGDAPVPELTFQASRVDGALEDCMALLGDVALHERFTGAGKCMVDFYRIGDGGNPVVGMRVSNYDSVFTNGANVGQISRNRSADRVVTRVLGYGARRQYMISVTTYDATAGKRLVDDWSAAQEAAVLADPQKTKPESPGYVAGMYRVFRRYRLPAALNGVRWRRDLPLVRSNGQAYGCQAWVWRNTVTWNAGTESWDVTANAAPTLIRNAHFVLDRGYVELPEPAIKVTALTVSADGVPQYTFAEAAVGITVAFEGETWLYYDTGSDASSDVKFSFKSDGLADVVRRDDLVFSQATNIGYAVGGYEWACLYMSEEDESAVTVSAATPIRNDLATLTGLCRDVLRERGRRHISYDVRIPYFTRAYEPGVAVELSGEADYVPGVYTVTGVEHDLKGNATTVTLDNVKPPFRQRGRV